jgi:acyl-CoA synthetase (AMP-forming)/AMP-acid ligase II
MCKSSACLIAWYKQAALLSVIFFLSQREPSLRTQFGEKVCAWIKKKDNAEARAVTAENIQAFCKEKIAHYKVRVP